MAKVNFRAGNLSQYNASTKDVNTLYFVTDAKKIFKGDVDVTSAVEIVTSFDGTAGAGNIALADAATGKFYVNATTFEMRVKNGAAWVIMSPGYIAAGGQWAQATDDSKLGTIGVIKTIIGQAIAAIPDVNTDIVFDQQAGTLKVGSGAAATLTGVLHGITYDSDQLQLTVNAYGNEAQVISLPKDNFVRSGRYEADYALPNPPGGTGPAIVLVVNDGEGADKEVVIPAASLVDSYTGGTSDNATITVSEGNVITATVKVDPIAGNALVSSASGLKVDISGKMDTYGTGAASEILVSDAEGKVVTRSAKTILSDGDMGAANTTIPTANLIAAAISTAVSTAQGELQSAIDAINAFMVGAGEADNIITSTTTSKLQRSGKIIGGATLNASPDANTVATEAAVAAALSWSTIE